MPSGPGVVASATDVARDLKPVDWGLKDPLDQQLLAGQIQQRAQTMQQSAATNAQELQKGSLGIQQTQQDLKDQQILGDVYRSMGQPAAVPGGSPAPAAGGVPQGQQGTTAIDPSAILMRALQDPRGFSGKGASALLSSAMEFRAKNAAIQKDQADTASKQAETNQKRNEAVFGATGGLLQMDPADRAAAFPAVRQRVIDEGHVDPSQIPEDYAQWGGDAQLIKTHLAFGTQAGIDAQNKSAADLASNKATEAANVVKRPVEQAKLEAEAANAKNLSVTGAPVTEGPYKGMTAAEANQAQARDTAAAEAKRHNMSEESTAKLTAGIAGGRLAMEREVNGMKYGPGTQEYWVEQLKDNPDSVSEMPAELRSAVGQKFRAATGLPLPKPAGAAAITQETAARNALDGIGYIQDAIKDPEIAANLGPIVGNIGNLEQKIGSAVGLSPQAEAKAQEIRTRMQYLFLQEGKATLGGRVPEQLMEALHSTSPRITMDPAMLSGALSGVRTNAEGIITNVDKSRFGGQARPPAMRGAATQSFAVTDPTGGVHTFSNQADANKFKALAHIQ